MASGRPIVFGSRQGEAIDELKIAGGALTYPSNSADDLSELILKIRDGEIEGRQLGQRYHDHIVKHHRREVWADQYLRFIRTL